MRLTVAAVGRLKGGPERELMERYWRRLEASARALGLAPVSLSEIAESRARDAPTRKREEGHRLGEATAGADAIVVLDEGGKAVTSRGLAEFIARRRDQGTRHLAFLIGGPDGHDAAVLKGASLILSLGPMTLPHGLARIVLAEQLYRSGTILSGHPYHRE